MKEIAVKKPCNKATAKQKAEAAKAQKKATKAVAKAKKDSHKAKKSTSKAEKATAKVVDSKEGSTTDTKNPLATAKADADLVKKFLNLASDDGKGNKEGIKVAQAQSAALNVGITKATSK